MPISHALPVRPVSSPALGRRQAPHTAFNSPHRPLPPCRAMDGKGAMGAGSAGQDLGDARQIETLEEQLAALREEECTSAFAGAPARPPVHSRTPQRASRLFRPVVAAVRGSAHCRRARKDILMTRFILPQSPAERRNSTTSRTNTTICSGTLCVHSNPQSRLLRLACRLMLRGAATPHQPRQRPPASAPGPPVVDSDGNDHGGEDGRHQRRD